MLPLISGGFLFDPLDEVVDDVGVFEGGGR